MESRLRNGIGGNLLPSLPLCCLHMGWFWIGVREGNVTNLLGACSWGVDHIPLVPPIPCLTVLPWSCTLPCHVTPALAPEALQSAGVFHILSIALCTCQCLGTPPPLGSSSYPTCSRRVVSRSVLAQASATIIGPGANRSIPVCPPSPMTPVPGTVWSGHR